MFWVAFEKSILDAQVLLKIIEKYSINSKNIFMSFD